jgi:hypothetical protein
MCLCRSLSLCHTDTCVDDSLKTSNILKPILEFTLLQSSCGAGGMTDLNNLFKSSKLWARFLQHFRSLRISIDQKAAPPKDEGLIPIWEWLVGAKGRLAALVAQINDESVCLGDLQLVLNVYYSDTEQARIRDLLHACDLSAQLSAAVMATRREQLAAFESLIARLQCFVNIYCSSLRVVLGDLPRQLLEIRNAWVTLILSDVQKLFLDLPIITSLDWLYSLRGSDLFLARWKHLGSKRVRYNNQHTHTERESERDTTRILTLTHYLDIL